MIDLVILSGGNSEEREVSIFSVKEILKNLNKNKYDIRVIDLPKNKNTDWILALLKNPPDVVLSGLHGGLGEDGSVQGLLECINIPYVGSKVLSSAICMDKAISLDIMRLNKIPVAKSIFLSKSELVINYEQDIKKLGFPLIVKPNKGGSSLNITIAKNFSEIYEGIGKIRKSDDDVLIEKYINGKEVTCGITETEKSLNVLAVLDVGTNKNFYDYDAKYSDENTKISFSTLPEFQQTMIKEIAKKAFRILKCSGYATLDLIINEEQIFVLELNTLPGLTSRSLFTKSVSKKGTSFEKFLDDIITFELNKNIKS